MILEKLRGIMAEQFDVDEEDIVAETEFIADLGADSLDLVELMMAVEEEFDLPALAEDEVEGFATVGELINFIRARID